MHDESGLRELGAALHDCWIDADRIERRGSSVHVPISERATWKTRAEDFARELIVSPVARLTIEDREQVGYYDFARFALDLEPLMLRIECNIPISIELSLAALLVTIEVRRRPSDPAILAVHTGP